MLINCFKGEVFLDLQRLRCDKEGDRQDLFKAPLKAHNQTGNLILCT